MIFAKSFVDQKSDMRPGRTEQWRDCDPTPARALTSLVAVEPPGAKTKAGAPLRLPPW
jgi:hypothetical protein